MLDGNITPKQWGEGCPSWASSVYDNSFNDGTEGSFNGKASSDELTPKVGAQYFFDAGMAYVTYSEEFRLGGFNGRATAPYNTGPYDPEGVESWEAAANLTLADNRFQVNLAVFSLKYDNKQETIFKPGTGGQTTLTVVQNASSAEIEGLEMDLKWVVAEGLTSSANVGLLDAGYDDYVVPSATGIFDQRSRD